MRKVTVKFEEEDVLFVEQFIDKGVVTMSDLFRMMLKIVKSKRVLQETFFKEVTEFKKAKRQKERIASARAMTRTMYWKNNLLTHLLKIGGGDFFSMGRVDMGKVTLIVDEYLGIFETFSPEQRDTLNGDLAFVNSLKDEKKFLVAMMNQSRFKKMLEWRDRNDGN